MGGSISGFLKYRNLGFGRQGTRFSGLGPIASALAGRAHGVRYTQGGARKAGLPWASKLHAVGVPRIGPRIIFDCFTLYDQSNFGTPSDGACSVLQIRIRERAGRSAARRAIERWPTLVGRPLAGLVLVLALGWLSAAFCPRLAQCGPLALGTSFSYGPN